MSSPQLSTRAQYKESGVVVADNARRDKLIGLSTGLGVAFGAAFGAGLGNAGMGVAAGIVIGAVIGVVLSGRAKPDAGKDDEQGN